MNIIYLMRHSISFGNEEKIVQGSFDYGLSNSGKELLKKIDYSMIKRVDNIYSSPYKRALETSLIVKNIINAKCDIFLDNDLVEKSAGILNGKSKQYLKKYKPNFLDIYLERGDYDLIPNGEKWKYTQARVLSFLERYIDIQNKYDLVVTHAAFMRMFLNTVNYKQRNNQIELPNGCIFKIKDPLKNLHIIKYEIAKSSTVFKISTFDNNYILKKTNKNICCYDYSIYKLLIFLSKYITVPKPIYMCSKTNYSIKIYDYIEGKHIFGKIDEANKKQLITETYKLYKLMNEYNENNKDDFETKDIISDMFYIRKNLKNKRYIKIVDELINDDELNIYLDIAEYTLVHNDLHRYNILFNEKHIGFLDFDGIKRCPEYLQIASFIATCFLLEECNMDIEEILKYWPERVQLNIVKKLIIYRLLYGLSFFDNKENKDNTDSKIRNKYIKAIERMI